MAANSWITSVPPILLLILFVILKVIRFLELKEIARFMKEQKEDTKQNLKADGLNFVVELLFTMLVAYAMYKLWLPPLISWLFLLPSLLSFFEKMFFLYVYLTHNS
jgi:hypothetical protein